MSTGRLLTAATALIAEQGYERTTLMQIAQRSGYSHGLITVRFGSKEGLLLALVDKWVDEWSEVRVLPTLGDSTGASALGIVIEALRASARRDPTRLRALYILMFEAVIGADVLMKRMQQEHERQFGLYRDMIQRGIDSGTVRASIDASEMAYLVITLIRGTAYQWLLNEAFDLDAALVSTIAVIHNLLDP